MAPQRVFVIAEAGVNHNGDLDIAERLVEVAAEAGADAVKFQTFRAEEVVTASGGKAAYQLRNTASSESQLEMLRSLELPRSWHLTLRGRCRERGIEFMSTAFDATSMDFLVQEVGVSRLKIPSGEITNAPLLLHAARSGLPVILSTGMSNLGEVETALGVLAFGFVGGAERPGLGAFQAALGSPEGQAALRAKLTLLHCTTEYPAPFDEVNLRAMDTLRTAFDLAVGLSDHTPGIAVPVAAAARGAAVIEKHFTLDRGLPGPDHKASLEPGELAAMVQAIRQVEQALGSGTKMATAAEIPNREVARRSLVAIKPVRKGEVFTAENLGVKRPGNGLGPLLYWDVLGRVAQRDFAADEQIDL